MVQITSEQKFNKFIIKPKKQQVIMSKRKIILDNPFNEPELNVGNVRFSLRKKGQLTQSEFQNQNKRKMRLLSLIINFIINKKIASAFRRIQFQPLRSIKLKKRLVDVFLSLIRRSQYNKKYEAFQRIKRQFIKQKNQEIKQLNSVLLKARSSAARILNIFFKVKERFYLEQSFKKIRQVAHQRYVLRNEKYRRAFRLWIKVHNSCLRKYFSKIRSSRFLIERRLRLSSMAKVVRQYREKLLKTSIQKLRRNFYIQRQNTIRGQIMQIESRIQNQQDEQLNGLKQKQQQLQKSLIQVKKEKQQLEQAYQLEVKQAEAKNIEIIERISSLKQQNQSLIKQIFELNQKLKENFSLDEVFQMFYNNLLLYILKHKNAPLIKTEMLDALTKPLIPVDIHIDSLREQNKVLKALLAEYVLLYGQKTLDGKQLEIPYEYLVKENQTMYKILLTLLPRLQYNKKDITSLRETMESVESLVKQFKM